jgi:hypothetical protein
MWTATGPDHTASSSDKKDKGDKGPPSEMLANEMKAFSPLIPTSKTQQTTLLQLSTYTTSSNKKKLYLSNITSTFKEFLKPQVLDSFVRSSSLPSLL